MKRQSQADRLLHLLEVESRWALEDFQWVSLPKIMALGIASHTKIVSILRAKGHRIECEREHKADGRLYTRYKLVKP